MSSPTVVTDDNFAEQVLQSPVPVLVDFWAEWCGPCRTIAPIVEQLAEEYEGKARVCKVDVDAAQKTAQEFGIRSIPTLLLFKDGKVVNQVVGALPKAAIVKELEVVLGA